MFKKLFGYARDPKTNETTSTRTFLLLGPKGVEQHNELAILESTPSSNNSITFTLPDSGHSISDIVLYFDLPGVSVSDVPGASYVRYRSHAIFSLVKSLKFYNNTGQGSGQDFFKVDGDLLYYLYSKTMKNANNDKLVGIQETSALETTSVHTQGLKAKLSLKELGIWNTFILPLLNAPEQSIIRLELEPLYSLLSYDTVTSSIVLPKPVISLGMCVNWYLTRPLDVTQYWTNKWTILSFDYEKSVTKIVQDISTDSQILEIIVLFKLGYQSEIVLDYGTKSGLPVITDIGLTVDTIKLFPVTKEWQVRYRNNCTDFVYSLGLGENSSIDMGMVSKATLECNLNHSALQDSDLNTIKMMVYLRGMECFNVGADTSGLVNFE